MTRAAPGTDDERDPPPNAALTRSIERLRRRVRGQRALTASSHAAVIALAALGPVLLYLKLNSAETNPHLPLLAAVAAVIAGAALLAAARPVAPLPLARAIDRAGHLADLVASAWEFSQLPMADRTPFMRATIATADARANAIAGSEAAPWRWPASAFATPLLALGIACLWNLKTPQPSAAKEIATLRPLALLAQLELNAERRALRSTFPTNDARLRAIADAYDELLERVALGKVERIELLRALDELDARLRAASSHSRDSEAALKELGQALSELAPTKPIGAALAQGDLVSARAALLRLAERARAPKPARELERLRAALRHALGQRQRAQQAKLAAARRELDRLQKRSEPDSIAQPNARASNKRELDQLQRDEAEPDDHATPLEDALARAANGDNGAEQSSRELEQAADHVEQMQRDASRDRAVERMRQQLEELRQRLADQASRSSEAQTDSPNAAPSPPPSAAEEPAADGASQPLDASEYRRRARGERAAPTGTTTPSDGSAQPAGLIVEPKPPPSAAGSGSAIGRQAGPAESAPGTEGRVQTGASTRAAAAGEDVALAGTLGHGPSRRSVIYDAAQRGFGSRAYQKVHAEYRDHAESELERESLPAGDRYYVHRYFQLIQPNEGSHD